MTLRASAMSETQRWRDRYDSAETAAARRSILRDAGAALGIRPQRVSHRWRRYGMVPRAASGVRPGGSVTLQVAGYCERWPYLSDREIARRVEMPWASIGWARRRLGIPSARVRRRKVLRAEVAAYAAEWPDMWPTQVFFAIVADDEIPFRIARQTVRRLWYDVRGRAA